MMKRTFYFLRDSVSGQFYTGQNNRMADGLTGAAVYHGEANAREKIRDIRKSWEHQQKFGYDYWKASTFPAMFDEKNQKELLRRDGEVVLRKNLPNWGIIIVDSTLELA